MRKANEIQLLAETLRGHTVTETQLRELEEKFGPKWRECNVYLDLTDEHFVKQLGREENRRHPVSFCELDALLDRFTSQHIRYVSRLGHNSYGVIKEGQTLSNLVFFVDHNSKFGCEKDVRMITIMRKKDFTTHDPIYEVHLQ